MHIKKYQMKNKISFIYFPLLPDYLIVQIPHYGNLHYTSNRWLPGIIRLAAISPRNRIRASKARDVLIPLIPSRSRIMREDYLTCPTNRVGPKSRGSAIPDPGSRRPRFLAARSLSRGMEHAK